MSQTPSTSKKAQRSICFRVDEEQHKLLAAAANRKNTTPSDYCRELSIAHVCKPHDEETISGVYRVALATLEDLLATKAILFRTMMALLAEQRDATSGISEAQKQELLAALPTDHPTRQRAINRHDVAGFFVTNIEGNKREKARQRLAANRG